MKFVILGATLLIASAGCVSGEEKADSAVVVDNSTAGRARSAAKIANAIAANPTAADSILKANNHTPESFQKLMYEIAADSAASTVYAGTVKAR